MEIFDIEITDEKVVFEIITALEEVKEGYRERKNVKFGEGWKLSVSRYIEANGRKDYLKTAISVRLANYTFGIKIVELLYYPQIEYLIRQGQEEISSKNLVVQSGSLFLIKKEKTFLISNGVHEWEIDDYERKIVAYAIRRLWFLKTENFYVTNQMATFHEIPIKEPVKFYLLMEV